MKTTTIIALIAILFSLNIQASEYNFKEEPNVNDIPFDTKEVFDSIMAEKEMATFSFGEEIYVDDIPFDTQQISQQYLFDVAMTQTFDFEEEAYINDIPTELNTPFCQQFGVSNEMRNSLCNK